MRFKTLNFYTFEAAFKNSIKTPKTEMYTRKALIIEMVDQEGRSYFGECNAFETDWYDKETITSVHNALKSWFDEEVLGKDIDDFNAAQTILDKLSMQPAARSTAAMALYQAFYNLESFSVEYGATASGLSDKQFEVLQKTEPKRVKLKWSDNVVDDLKKLQQLQSSPLLALDANESLNQDDIPNLQEIKKRFDILYIEEPFRDLNDLNDVEKETIPSIALDEKALDIDSILRYIENYNVNTVILKPFRLGGIDRILEAIIILHQEDIKVVIGGMYEYGLSRYFTAYLSRLGDYPGDITPYGYYFAEEFTEENGILNKGRIEFAPPVINKNQLKRY
ncbi:o-succinylbenzoate synthase [Staphylococcus condimenti]|uniref:o-succinylbenzoate synthase n=1 Tax=Staphylococcus condimenti TaxID=70255 RepID=A0A143P7Q0_9STAP|nr:MULTISPECIES: o-succinylbenzoate synthase [Staphylococcus]AMY04487.1 o-succinylbenzoate synthase [Staphylococcus condimenti]APR60724.1 o-succinylbenzoate synthase [Staphylococcus condimenti]MDK8646423.1 o-succinylbenzoate synthase [Staphylococcus condimenti]OFO98867.1 o-succinylbenzoate synthase [Staphylococcus sp. HMSC065E08]PNZ58942.1 o-succinylbenzoate synthase [Staphylococcus condimenti]